MIHWDSRNKELKGKYSCPLWNCFMANVPAAFWKGKVIWVLYKAIKGLNFLEDFLPRFKKKKKVCTDSVKMMYVNGRQTISPQGERSEVFPSKV